MVLALCFGVLDLAHVWVAGRQSFLGAELALLGLALLGLPLMGALVFGSAVVAAAGRVGWSARAGGATTGLIGGFCLGLVVASIRPELSGGGVTLAAVTVLALVGGVGGAFRPWVAHGIWIGAFGLSLSNRPELLERPNPPVGPPPTGGDIVLITLDTVRADHIGAVGGAHRTIETPALDALADEGALYTHGVAPVPLTLPSHVSMLSGDHPVETEVLRNGDRVPTGLETVVEQFRQRGYRTGAFVSSYVLRNDTGLGRSFDHYDDRSSLWDHALDGHLADGLRRLSIWRKRPSQRPGADTVAHALRWLHADERPALLWVHLYDAHGPYDPPPELLARYPLDDPEGYGNKAQLEALRDESRNVKLQPLSQRDLRVDFARYAAEVTEVDGYVAALLAGLPAETPLVVASDHGESLMEHGEILNHGNRAYESTLRVPIIVRAPGRVGAGQVHAAPVALQRVGPTLLWLAGDAAAEAEALSGPIEEAELVSYSPAQAARLHFGLSPRWRVALREGHHKWILTEGVGLEYYLLDADPEELDDRADGAEDVEAVRARAEAQLDGLKAVLGQGHARNDDTTEALRELGYIE